MPTLQEMISFHRIYRLIFIRLIMLGTLDWTAKKIISLWMYLELIGVDLVHFISDIRDDTTFSIYVAEAESIIRFLDTGNLPGEGFPGISHTSFRALERERFNMKFFAFNRDVIVSGVNFVMADFGPFVFFQPELDLAALYSSRIFPSPVVVRTLFITFLGRFSGLRVEDIYDLFGRLWENCIQNVEIEQTEGEDIPIYGRILLSDESFIESIFCCRPVLVMQINGGQMTVRKFATY